MVTMVIPQVSRWALARLVRQPGSWVVVALLTSIWPLVELVHPLGITTTRSGEAGTLYEIAYLATLASAMASQGTVGRAEPLLVPLGPTRRAAAENALHLAVGALYLAPILVVAWFTRAPRSAFAISRLPAGAALALLHLAALALVLRRLPLSPHLRVAALPLLAWALPALVSSGPRGYDFLSALDAGRHLDLAQERPGSGAHRIVASLPIIGWSAVGLLMNRPHPHALRRPR